MTNKNVELHDDEKEVTNEAHDPKNAEAKSIDSVDKAGDVTKQAAPRSGDKRNAEPMAKRPSTKAGILNAVYTKMSGMKKGDLISTYSKVVGEDLEIDEEDIIEEDIEGYDYESELNELAEGEATLSEEFKEKTVIIFEAALNKKIAEETDRLEEQYREELAEEISEITENVIEKVDGYLNYVVEKWMEENTIAIQEGLRTEIAEEFMGNLKTLFEESYITVPDSKVNLVDELSDRVSDLEENLSARTKKAIELSEEISELKRAIIIAEASEGLAETQAAKLEDLLEKVDFDDEESFAKKVQTIKESYFPDKKTQTTITEEEGGDDDDTVEISSVMEHYLKALNRK